MMIEMNLRALRQRSEMDNSPTSRFRFVKLFEFKNRNNKDLDRPLDLDLDLDFEDVPAASGIDLRFFQKNLCLKMKEFHTSI